jgi:hypothetical protein
LSNPININKALIRQIIANIEKKIAHPFLHPDLDILIVDLETNVDAHLDAAHI